MTDGGMEEWKSTAKPGATRRLGTTRIDILRLEGLCCGCVN